MKEEQGMLKIEFMRLDEDKWSAAMSEENKCQMVLNVSTRKQKRERGKEEKRTKRPLLAGMKVGHWTTEEKKKYHWFLEIYHSHFENKQMRRMDKIFKTMADFLTSRAADQCRSHHQKMEKKYKTFYNILFNLRMMHYHETDPKELQSQIEVLNIPLPDYIIPDAELLFKLQQTETKVQPPENDSQLGFSLQPRSPKYQHHPVAVPCDNSMDQPLKFLDADLSHERLI